MTNQFWPGTSDSLYCLNIWSVNISSNGSWHKIIIFVLDVLVNSNKKRLLNFWPTKTFLESWQLNVLLATDLINVRYISISLTGMFVKHELQLPKKTLNEPNFKPRKIKWSKIHTQKNTFYFLTLYILKMQA